MNLTQGLILTGVATYLMATVAVCPFSCRSSGPSPEVVHGDTSSAGDSGTDTGDATGDTGSSDTGRGEDTASADVDSPSDGTACDANETFVQDACIQCGPAGGCAEREARCVATCGELSDCQADDRDVPTTCQDGVCRNVCD